jgi:hypothetical protein
MALEADVVTLGTGPVVIKLTKGSIDAIDARDFLKPFFEITNFPAKANA